jgi:hypothetical protein
MKLFLLGFIIGIIIMPVIFYLIGKFKNIDDGRS